MNQIDLNFEEKPYLTSVLNKLNALYSFRNKIVLEVGSDKLFASAKIALQLGAKLVYCVDSQIADPNYKIPDDPRIIIISKNLENVHNIKNNSIDFIYGIAVLEHVIKIRKFFEKIGKLLTPSGAAVIQGEPMWVSYFGHHVWLPDAEKPMLFNDEKLNPFVPWQHLSLDYESCFEFLRLSGYSIKDSKRAATQIYKSNHISRYGTEYIIKEIIKARGIKIRKFSISNKSPKHNDFYKKAQEHFSNNELNAQYIEVMLYKESK
jgi:hypothetical protein